MDAHAGALRGLLRVGAAHGDAPWLADALVAFHGDHPGVRMALRQGSTAGVLERLRRGALDLAVTGLTAVERAGLGLATAPADGAGLATAPADAAGRVAYGSGGLLAEPLATDRLVLACAPGHPLADRAHVAIGDLRDEPFVLPEPETALREAVLAAFAPAGFSPVPRFETTDPATVRLLVHAGLGVSLVPASWLRMPGPAVVAAPLPGDVADYERFAVRPAGAEAPAGRLLMHRLRAPVR
jgi:DNA-binding transcriptional LysR family regulator